MSSSPFGASGGVFIDGEWVEEGKLFFWFSFNLVCYLLLYFFSVIEHPSGLGVDSNGDVVETVCSCCVWSSCGSGCSSEERSYGD